MRSMRFLLCTGVLLTCTLPLTANAATVFGPSPYLQTGDTPANFFCEQCDFHIEDFEDNLLDPFLTIDNGSILPPGAMSGEASSVTDSVDGDDGAIDGNGNNGHSWFTGADGAVDRTLTISFASTVTSAGFVFTDGDSLANSFTAEAFDIDGNLLGTLDAGALSDAYYTGETQEDRFIGFRDLTGIAKLTFSMNAGTGIEIDHIQWQDCQCVPEPAALGLISCGALGMLVLRRRRR